MAKFLDTLFHMIRTAHLGDLPAILDMTACLHETAGVVIPMNRAYTQGFLQALMAHADGLVLVAEKDGEAVGMLVASIGNTSISPAPVAIEHGWFVRPEARGVGGLLLTRYEDWAREKGCFAVRMSTPPGAEGPALILERKGFAQSEIAWAKVL
jgi:GNAT superfamily N-acetyltransferase